MTEPIYLDNNATTKPAPEVVEAVIPLLKESFGNPSSSHPLGQRASFAVAQARRQVASCLGAQPEEIIFTSGGTESDNLAIRSLLQQDPRKTHMVTTAIEHEAVFRLAQHLESQGIEVTYLGVDQAGRLDLDEFRDALRPTTALASVMYANNETGVLFPMEEIVEICNEKNIPLHTDAVQAIGKLPINLNTLQVAMLSLSAHKFHGPKGVGALFIRKPATLPAQIIGGEQERDIRGGTENVPGIVGLGVAAKLVEEGIENEHHHLRKMRDHMEQAILSQVPFAKSLGGSLPRLPNTSMIAFEGLSAEAILVALSERGVCASGGSACHSGSLLPSRVLQAMKVDLGLAGGAIRLSLSRYTTQRDVDALLSILPELAKKLSSVPAA